MNIKQRAGKKTIIFTLMLISSIVYFWPRSYPENMRSVNSLGEACTVLQPDSESVPHFWVTVPGKYCLIYDYTCKHSKFDWENLNFCRSLMKIDANNVDIDLMGHTLDSGSAISGVGRRISIRNGRLKGAVSIGKTSRRVDSVGPQYEIRSNSTRFNIYNKPEDVPLEDWLAKNPPPGSFIAYVNPEIEISMSYALLDNVEIITRGGIRLSGGGSIIKNSTITLNYKTTKTRGGFLSKAYLGIEQYGPKATFINNDITINLERSGDRTPVYGIYLQDSDGSHIKNNRIQFNKMSVETVGIGIRTSKRVVVHKNDIFEAERKFHIFSDSTTNLTAIDNTLEVIK